MPKVSFILPIYNVEDFLPQCIDSILCQTYNDFEILLVDDGSPDNCGYICDNYARKYSQIRVIHKPNGGLSDARNIGLSQAQGDYIIFVDSDDFWVGKDCLEKLMNVVIQNSACDFIGFNCLYYYNNKKTYSRWGSYSSSLVVPTDRDLAIQLLVASGSMPMSACLKIISRKYLLNKQISFIKGIHAEDIPWFIDLLDGCKKCMFVNHYIYAYRQEREGSITSSAGEKSFNNLFSIIKNELAKIDSRSFSEESKNALRSFLAYEYCILLALLGSLDKSIQYKRRQELFAYRWLLKYTLDPKVKKVAMLYKFLGIKVTELVLRVYLNIIKK